MSRGVDPAKAALWRERFARFGASAMRTEEFCIAEGVSKPSFYSWRRKLGLSTPRQNKSPRRSAFQQVIVSSAPPALTARLPGGVQIEVPVAHENALRAVVGELIRAVRLVDSEAASC
jgi:hypothetical protein